jgi:hypothetical protein
MSEWYVWGDYVHTMPERIGQAVHREDAASAKRAAQAAGFDFERRMRNGFEPWAAVFDGPDGRDQESAFASYPTVRGWKRR